MFHEFYFLRCAKVAYIFQLKTAFMHIYKPYFTPQNVARLAIFYEVYYLLTRRYGKDFYSDTNFSRMAIKTRKLAIHVALKNKIQHIAKLNFLSHGQVCHFCNSHSTHQVSDSHFLLGNEFFSSIVED